MLVEPAGGVPNMNGIKHWLIVLTLALIGAWGCSQQETAGPSSADRAKALEVKNGKLEEDFRAVAAARDQLRRKLAAAEEQQQQLQKQLDEIQVAQRQRDEAVKQLAVRTVERDNLLGQLEGFRKSLRDLLGQVEVAIPHEAEPITAMPEENTDNRS
jgi:predicted nuclease with TOPRIM domain